MKHKMYTLTTDMKEWLQNLIYLMQAGQRKDLAQSWLDNATAVSNDDLNVLVSLYDNNSTLYPQAQSFSSWVKGGDRPGNPHG